GGARRHDADRRRPPARRPAGPAPGRRPVAVGGRAAAVVPRLPAGRAAVRRRPRGGAVPVLRAGAGRPGRGRPAHPATAERADAAVVPGRDPAGRVRRGAPRRPGAGVPRGRGGGAAVRTVLPAGAAADRDGDGRRQGGRDDRAVRRVAGDRRGAGGGVPGRGGRVRDRAAPGRDRGGAPAHADAVRAVPGTGGDGRGAGRAGAVRVLPGGGGL
ncbi:MAG: hypothetical protein AVDCRST_MAG41-3922, partial [uncultured Corynebacteriales bacterium]